MKKLVKENLYEYLNRKEIDELSFYVSKRLDEVVKEYQGMEIQFYELDRGSSKFKTVKKTGKIDIRIFVDSSKLDLSKEEKEIIRKEQYAGKTPRHRSFPESRHNVFVALNIITEGERIFNVQIGGDRGYGYQYSHSIRRYFLDREELDILERIVKKLAPYVHDIDEDQLRDLIDGMEKTFLYPEDKKDYD